MFKTLPHRNWAFPLRTFDKTHGLKFPFWVEELGFQGRLSDYLEQSFTGHFTLQFFRDGLSRSLWFSTSSTFILMRLLPSFSIFVTSVKGFRFLNLWFSLADHRLNYGFRSHPGKAWSMWARTGIWLSLASKKYMSCPVFYGQFAFLFEFSNCMMLDASLFSLALSFLVPTTWVWAWARWPSFCSATDPFIFISWASMMLITSTWTAQLRWISQLCFGGFCKLPSGVHFFISLCFSFPYSTVSAAEKALRFCYLIFIAPFWFHFFRCYVSLPNSSFSFCTSIRLSFQQHWRYSLMSSKCFEYFLLKNRKFSLRSDSRHWALNWSHVGQIKITKKSPWISALFWIALRLSFY